METKDTIEIANIPEITEFRAGAVIKKVPIISDQIMASLMFIDFRESIIVLKDSNADMIYHVISGSGKIIIDKEETDVREGTLILVPKGRIHFFSIESQHMTVLCVKPVRTHIDNMKKKEAK